MSKVSFKGQQPLEKKMERFSCSTKGLQRHLMTDDACALSISNGWSGAVAGLGGSRLRDSPWHTLASR